MTFYNHNFSLILYVNLVKNIYLNVNERFLTPLKHKPMQKDNIQFLICIKKANLVFFYLSHNMNSFNKKNI